MNVTPQALNAIFTGFSTEFQRAYDAVQPIWPQLASRITSTGSRTVHGFLAKLPRMREWLGDRVIQNAETHAHTIENKNFELTFAVSRNDIEDDSIGVYSPIIQAYAQQVALYPDDLLLTALMDGESTVCYDGQYFFDTDHPVNKYDSSSASQQNYWSSGKALSAANYTAVRAAMRGFKGEDGKSLRVNPKLLVVPPQLEETAKRIVMADNTDNTAGTAGITNVNKGTAEVLVIEDLADEATTWYLLDTTKPVKPFVFQERQAARFFSDTSPDSESVKMKRQFMFGADTRGNVGHGLWFLAAKAVG